MFTGRKDSVRIAASEEIGASRVLLAILLAAAVSASNIAQQDGEAAGAEAQTLDRLFGEVEQYFAQRGDAPDGVEMSRKSRALIAAVAASVTAKDFDAAATTASELNRNCKSCHRLYKKDE